MSNIKWKSQNPFAFEQGNLTTQGDSYTLGHGIPSYMRIEKDRPDYVYKSDTLLKDPSKRSHSVTHEKGEILDRIYSNKLKKTTLNDWFAKRSKTPAVPERLKMSLGVHKSLNM